MEQLCQPFLVLIAAISNLIPIVRTTKLRLQYADWRHAIPHPICYFASGSGRN